MLPGREQNVYEGKGQAKPCAHDLVNLPSIMIYYKGFAMIPSMLNSFTMRAYYSRHARKPKPEHKKMKWDIVLQGAY